MSASEYYNHTTFPAANASGSSAAMRAELEAIETGFGKLPDLSGNGSKVVVINSGGTAMEATSSPNIGTATATSVNGLVLNDGAGSGTNNVAVGTDALSSLTTAANQTAIGAFAGRKITTASGPNTLIGASAGAELTTGRNNTGIGSSAFANKVTGNYNVAIGDSAHSNVTTGDNTICIGYNANPSAAGASNEITLGDSSIATLRCQVTSITALSDRRDKTDIAPLATGLGVVMQLKPVAFTWNMRDGGKVGIKDAGFIAQDLQEVDDEWLKLVYAENPEKLEASYGRLIPVLVKAIQELKQEVDTLRAELLG